jgi:Recombination enhancement, RecA-dependent nuclease
VISRNMPRATAYEARRINRMKAEIGCICCLLRTGVQNYHVEVHHIVRGNKRLGHWYTLPLCRSHHRIRGVGGIFTSVADGSKAFNKIHGTQLDLWVKVQHMLELSDELPATKVLPRRLPHVDALRSARQPAHPEKLLAGGERGALQPGDARVAGPQSRLVGAVEAGPAVSLGVRATGLGGKA